MARPAHPVGLSGPVAREAHLPFRTRASGLDRSVDALHQMDPAAIFGLGIVALFVLAAALAPLIEPRDPLAQDLASRLKPPGYLDPKSAVRFWLGTDGLGRDMLSRLIEGARVSLLVGAGGASLSALLGTTIGLSAGYGGGWYDAVMMRIVDVWQAVPYTILAIAVAVILGPSLQ